jgi:hypothetical protein
MSRKRYSFVDNGRRVSGRRPLLTDVRLSQVASVSSAEPNSTMSTGSATGDCPSAVIMTTVALISHPGSPGE